MVYFGPIHSRLLLPRQFRIQIILVSVFEKKVYIKKVYSLVNTLICVKNRIDSILAI